MEHHRPVNRPGLVPKKCDGCGVSLGRAGSPLSGAVAWAVVTLGAPAVPSHRRTLMFCRDCGALIETKLDAWVSESPTRPAAERSV